MPIFSISLAYKSHVLSVDTKKFVIKDILIAFGGGGFVFNGEDFFLRFGILYARGIVFFVVHIVSNFILFALLFRPLCELVNKLKIKMFPEESL